MAVFSVPNSTPFVVDKNKTQKFDAKSKEMRKNKSWQKRLLAHENGKVEWKTIWK